MVKTTNIFCKLKQEFYRVKSYSAKAEIEPVDILAAKYNGVRTLSCHSVDPIYRIYTMTGESPMIFTL